tara:strand:+ start:491 stop:661 length:171 start_codon:yes stop_codon:yes gene_type:complete
MINYKNDERISFADVVEHPWFTQTISAQIDREVLSRLQGFKNDNFFKNTVMDQLIK